MTIDIAQLRRAINPCPGFMLTRDQTEAMQKLVRQLIQEHEQALAKLAEYDQWTSLDEKWPEEAESVLIFYGDEICPAYWQYEQEGDWESGYKKYRVWYSWNWDSIPGIDEFDACLDRVVLWKPFPDKPVALMESLTSKGVPNESTD